MTQEKDETRQGTPEALKTPPDAKGAVGRGISDMPSAIDGHELIKEIGRGGMAAVYLAREAGWGREVALKVVPSGLKLVAHDVRIQLGCNPGDALQRLDNRL